MAKHLCLLDATVMTIANGDHDTNLMGVQQRWESWAVSPKGRRVVEERKTRATGEWLVS